MSEVPLYLVLDLQVESTRDQLSHLLNDSGFRVQGAGCRVQDARFRVQGSGFRVQGLEYRVQVSGFRDSFS